MGKKEELLFSINEKIKAPEAAAPADREKIVLDIIRRWFQKDDGSPAKTSEIRTRIKDLASKSDNAREIARNQLKDDRYLTQQPEFDKVLTEPLMDKFVEEEKARIPDWLPHDNIQSPLVKEFVTRVALLPDKEDPARLYEQLTLMYQSANFKDMSPAAIREFRYVAEKTKERIFKLSEKAEKNFHVTANDDIESPWRKKVDIYRSRRLPEAEANPTNDPVIAARNSRRASFDAFLKDMQEQLEVEDPKKEGKALIELRERIGSHMAPDNSGQTTKMGERRSEPVFNESEAQEYIGIINKRLETIGSEERWTPIQDEVAAGGPATRAQEIDRAKLLKGFEIDPAIVAKLTPEVRAYYEKVKNFLRVAPSEDITPVTINGFLQQMEMLSRNRDPVQGRSPESDAATLQLLDVIQGRLNRGELSIPTSIYLDVSEVREIMGDFPGWAEKYMRKIELLIAERGTDDPALRPAMDRFNLAQEFYGSEFFKKNLVSPDLPPEEAARLTAIFEKTYKDRVYVMDQYRVRLAHAELENQLEFVRDWDPKSQDVARVVEIAKRLGDQGIFAMRGYHGGMVDVVASNYLLPIMSETVFHTGDRKRFRWTKGLFAEVRDSTKARFKQDLSLYNEQYIKHMMKLRWRARGSMYIEADGEYMKLASKVTARGPLEDAEVNLLNTITEPGSTLADTLLKIENGTLSEEKVESLKQEIFNKRYLTKLANGEIKYGSLIDADSDETVDSIVRTAISSARLQFQVEEKVALSQRARFAAMETDYSAFVFAGWEERLMKANYFYTDNKYRWGIEPHEAAMWRDGNKYIMTVDPKVRKYAEREATTEWDAFNKWWDQFHSPLHGNTEWSGVEAQLKAFKISANPAQKELYDKYVHFVQQFYGYPPATGSVIGPDKKETYGFFSDLKTDRLRGKAKFMEQVESAVVTPWQEDHLTRSYLYWKSGERTQGYKDELKKVMGNADIKYYFRGRELLRVARDYFMPNEKIDTAETREKLLEEITGLDAQGKELPEGGHGQAGYHPLQFIQLKQRVEGIKDFNPEEFDEASQRFHMIQGVILSKTLEDPQYKPIDYLHLTDFQERIVAKVFEDVKPDASLPMTKDEYLAYMRKKALYVQKNAKDYTDLKYAELLGREILYYDDQPQAIIDPEHTVTASKGASNLYARALFDHIKGVSVADLQDHLFTLDLKTLEEVSEQVRLDVRNYAGAQDGAVAKALALARYAGYTRGHIDLRDVLFRNKMMVSEAQEIGKSPAAPANSPLELEQILGEAQKTERIENFSPAFGQALDSFAGVSSWSKVTGGADGPLAKILGERNYRKFIRYFNDRVPTHITLLRFRNTLLFFGITVGMFIVKQTESGGEERRRE